MLDDWSANEIKLEVQRNGDTSNSNQRMNRLEPPSHAIDHSNNIQPNIYPSNSAVNSSLTDDHNTLTPSSLLENRIKLNPTLNNHQNHDSLNNIEQSTQQLRNQHANHQLQIRHQSSVEEQYFTSDETNSSSYNLDLNNTTAVEELVSPRSRLSQVPVAPEAIAKASTTLPPTDAQHLLQTSMTTFDSTRQSSNSMLPATAHCSDQHNNMHYSLLNSKSLPTSSPSNMALNFSHDLLAQTNHQGHSSHLHHNNDNGSDQIKSASLNNQIDLDSGNQIMQTGMNMWKNTMGLNFKHPVINEHSFLPPTDMNSFSNWTHSNNLANHQTAPGINHHHILDSQHLINYQQQINQQRPIHLTSNQQELVSNSLKNQVCAEQASFMLNSLNHPAVVSQTNHQNASHSTPHQTNDNLHLRHEHNTGSYNLSMNDQFYNNRSHGNHNIKSSVLLHDRSGSMSLSGHHVNQLAYHNSNHSDLMDPQPTTSQHQHQHISVGPSSSCSSSKSNTGTFKCPHCAEMFNMRNLFQSHLKTHSQEKGFKAKFNCEQCGHCFSQKTSLNRHMKSHTGERPFPCETCGKAFSEKERLKIHMRTHTGEKPFSCGVCGKSFSQKSTVKRHQTVHTGEKKFKCDCGKGFANRGNLIAHIKTRGTSHSE